MRSLHLAVLCIALTSLGCAALNVDDPRFTDAGSSSAAHDAGTELDASVGSKDALPRVEITKPVAGAQISAGKLRIEGTAADDHGIAVVEIKVGPNVPLIAKTSDDYRHFWLESAVPNGMFFIEAQARDTKGQLGEADRIAVMGPSAGTDAAKPVVVVSSPPDKSAPLHALVLVRGTAQDDLAVVTMDAYRNGELLKERKIETDDFFASWSRLVPLIPGIDNELEFVARDAAGHTGSAKITLFGRAEIDRTAPALAVTAPKDGATLNAAELTVTGTASDQIGIREVKLRVGSAPTGSTTLVWGDYAVVDTQDGYATWSKKIPIPVGPFELEARAIDLNGLGTSVTLKLENDFVPTWSEEVAIPLRLRDETAAPVLDFELDKAGVNDVISPDIQKDITLLELETTTMLTDAVSQIKESCGTKWRDDNANPQHDCSVTELGQTYGDAQGVPWQQSPEYSLVRLLTMTPRNVVVAGTSIARLESLANSLNIGGGFSEILADTLGIGITSEIISTTSVVKALQNYWMASHPNVLPGAKLPITLYDGMNDLGPMKDRFGPAGGHPGLLDPSFTPHAAVFDSDFKLLLGASSNLRWMDGVDLTTTKGETSKDYIALVVDTTGPNYDDVLEFDFTDPAKFDVQGLVDHPKAALRMSMQENAAWISSCLPSQGTDSGCKANLPSAPRAGYVWSIPRWQVETLIAGGGYEQYKTRANYSKDYWWIVKAATITVGSGNPAGWSTFDTFANFGSPPEDQYLWELILEVGQKALHNFSGTTLAEGQANVAFTLSNVDVGLTAEQIRAATRPELQKQRHKLSDKLLGNYEKNNGAVDFFYRRGTDENPYLFFAAASDPLPDASYTYTSPGFFAEASISTKLSSTSAGTSGDSVHEKLSLAEGETTVYVRDESGSVFRLRFVVGRDPTEIEVHVSKKVH